MAAAPQQSPRTNFPQAEYFNLTPNANVALGQRVRQDFQGSLTSVALNSSNSSTGNVVVDPLWTYGNALYVVRMQILFSPTDTTGFLHINSVRMGLGTANNFLLDVGIPTGTLANPLLPMIVMYERDLLVHQSDLPISAIQQPLTAIWQVAITNADGAAAHTFTMFGSIIFHGLKGMTT
jgi:hypothetical protein